jgi:hypothetical protein
MKSNQKQPPKAIKRAGRKAKYANYKLFHQRERNKLRYLRKHQPKNLQDIKALERQLI